MRTFLRLRVYDLQQFLLCMDRGDIAHARAWYRRLLWRSLRTPKSKLKGVVKLMVWPLTSAVRSARAVRQFGPGVDREYRVGPWRQFLQCWLVMAMHGMSSESYYKFRLFLPDRRAKASQYLQHIEIQQLWPHILRSVVASGMVERLENKIAFSQWCATNGIPTVAEAVPANPSSADDRRGLESLVRGPSDLISKPVDSWCGIGVRRWLKAAAGTYRRDDGAVVTTDQMLSELTASRSPQILQARLSNHASMQGLTLGGLCTVRLVTVAERGHPPTVAVSVLRMPTGDSPADNFERGGLAIGVDPASGCVTGSAVSKSQHLGVKSYSRHPDTGCQFEGVRLPYWSDAIAIALRAHSLVDLPFVGWDVAIVADGALLLEANPSWCVELAQMPTGIPLGHTAVALCLKQFMHEAHVSAARRSDLP